MNQDIFNSKFNQLIRNDHDSDHDDQPDIDIFVLFNNINTVSITNLRVLIFAKFLVKFLNIPKIIINVVPANQQTSHETRENLKKILEKFKLDADFELNMIDIGDLKRRFIEANLKYDSKFVENRDDGARINFEEIIKELKLGKYDINIKYGDLETEIESPNFLAYWFFLQSISKSRVFQICANNEFYQRQKADLTSRIFNGDKSRQVRFIQVGHVMAKDAMEIYQEREEYFRHASLQRQMIADEELVERNLESFSLFSIVYDLFATGHQKDVKLSTVDPDRLSEVRLGDQAAFVLYNCARLSSLLEKFKLRVREGLYSDIGGSYNFWELMTSEMERNLCQNILFKLDGLKQELRGSFEASLDEESISLKIPIAKLVRYLYELSNSFSRYYSKIQILEDPNFKHLHDKMKARIHLLRIIYRTIESILNYFGAKTLTVV